MTAVTLLSTLHISIRHLGHGTDRRSQQYMNYDTDDMENNFQFEILCTVCTNIFIDTKNWKNMSPSTKEKLVPPWNAWDNAQVDHEWQPTLAYQTQVDWCLNKKTHAQVQCYSISHSNAIELKCNSFICGSPPSQSTTNTSAYWNIRLIHLLNTYHN